jgi:predicted homoserine dehydrogenase-like protein
MKGKDMHIVDTALAKQAAEGKSPIRIGMIGAGFMAGGVALQVNTVHPETMRIVAIANRTPGKAVEAYAGAGQDDAAICDNAAALARAIENGQPAVTEDPLLVATSPHVDVLLEVTGAIEHALPAVLAAIDHGKHVVLMNAELDGTVGPLLKHRADAAGVIYTNVDGDQPGVQMNLWRFVRGIGVTPVLCGNIKGLHDPYRTPTTQAEFAHRWGQNPAMVTSFADGTKISFEQAIVANATGMRVAQARHARLHGGAGHADRRGERALRCRGPAIRSRDRGLRRGRASRSGRLRARHHRASPSAPLSQPLQARRGAALLFLHALPSVPFRSPQHDRPRGTSRRCGDRAVGPPRVDVVATAKTDLAAGDTLDGIGGYAAEGLVPIGVAVGARLRRPVAKDTALTYADVALPEGRLVDRLRAEQAALWPVGGD